MIIFWPRFASNSCIRSREIRIADSSPAELLPRTKNIAHYVWYSTHSHTHRTRSTRYTRIARHFRRSPTKTVLLTWHRHGCQKVWMLLVVIIHGSVFFIVRLKRMTSVNFRLRLQKTFKLWLTKGIVWPWRKMLSLVIVDPLSELTWDYKCSHFWLPFYETKWTFPHGKT